MYNTSIGRFISSDPLATKFPMLSTYQFASNSPIWALDLDGKEALIIHPDRKHATVFANVYYVTSGEGAVANTNTLKTAIQERLLNRVSEANEGRRNGVLALNFKINHITTDENGKPLTLDEARRLSSASTVYYTDQNGQSASMSSWKIGTVVQNDFTGEIDKEGESTLATYRYDEKQKQNTIFVRNQVGNVLKIWNSAVQFHMNWGIFWEDSHGVRCFHLTTLYTDRRSLQGYVASFANLRICVST